MDKWLTLKQALEYDLVIMREHYLNDPALDFWGNWVRCTEQVLDLMRELEAEDDDRGSTAEKS